jgi:hypothetical protein
MMVKVILVFGTEKAKINFNILNFSALIDACIGDLHEIGLAGQHHNHTFVRLVKTFKFGHHLHISCNPVSN